MNWLKEWARQAKEIILSPADFYDKLDVRGNYSYPMKFVFTSIVISAVLTFFVREIQLMVIPDYTLPARFTGISGLTFSLLTGLVVGIFLLLARAGFIQIFAYFFGYTGYNKTFEAISYPTAMIAVLGWIPFVNIFVFIYQLYAEVKGVEKIHGMSTGKAAASVILGSICLGVVFVGATILILNSLTTAMAPPVENFGPAAEAFMRT